MLNLRGEIQGIRVARAERQTLGLLASALTGGLATGAVDDATADTLFRAAQKHGVLGLFPLRHPSFAMSVAAARAKAMRALKFTHRVVKAIEGAGIPVVVLKGAVAASRWPDPTLRQQSDVDVLVDKADKDRAAEALIEAKVCSQRFLDSEHMHNDSLQPAEASGLLVEVHHYFNNHHETRVEVGELLSRRVRVKSASGELPALSAEDDAVYLAMHATTHALQRLAWMVDLATLRADWATAASRARAWGVSTAVRPAWARARELLAAPISQRAFAALSSPRPSAALSDALLAATDSSDGATHRFFERLFRISVVPAAALPRVMLQKLRSREEERVGYESLGQRPH
ncbi:MAG: nucleotidyltransferase family protein [Myxococcaceae bacterium]|nr:nucleotidyltransferase family protein [Myxococcaceae bacterium]